MSNDVSRKIDFLTLIAGRKQRDALLRAVNESGGRLVNSVYGKGSVKSDYLREVLGLVPEENKIVITCLLPHEKTDALLGMLVSKFHFDQPNTGMAFTVPVERISF